MFDFQVGDEVTFNNGWTGRIDSFEGGDMARVTGLLQRGEYRGFDVSTEFVSSLRLVRRPAQSPFQASVNKWIRENLSV